MGLGFKENAHLKTDTKKFEENFSKIDWGGETSKVEPVELKEIKRIIRTTHYDGDISFFFDDNINMVNFRIDYRPIDDRANRTVTQTEITNSFGENFAKLLGEVLFAGQDIED